MCIFFWSCVDRQGLTTVLTYVLRPRCSSTTTQRIFLGSFTSGKLFVRHKKCFCLSCVWFCVFWVIPETKVIGWLLRIGAGSTLSSHSPREANRPLWMTLGDCGPGMKWQLALSATRLETSAAVMAPSTPHLQDMWSGLCIVEIMHTTNKWTRLVWIRALFLSDGV